ALAHLVEDLLADLVDGPTRAEGSAAAVGAFVVADAGRADNLRADVGVGNAERFGKLHGQRGAAAADVCRAFDQVDRAVGVDAGAGARFTAPVEPEAGRHAPPALLARQRRAVMRVVARRLQRFDEADARQFGTIGAAVALAYCVAQAEFDGSAAELLCQFIDDGFRGEDGVGAARRPVRGR